MTFQCPEHTGARSQVSQAGEHQESHAEHLIAPSATGCLGRSWSTHGGEARSRECRGRQDQGMGSTGQEGPCSKQMPVGGLFPLKRAAVCDGPAHLQGSNPRDKR